MCRSLPYTKYVTMNLFATLTALSTSAPLASRAFMPLFIVCLLAGYPEICAWLNIQPIVIPPTLQWLVSDEFLIIVGVLAVLECIADKSIEIKAFLDDVQKFIKAAVAVLITLTVLPPEAQQLAPDVQQAGLVSHQGFVALCAGGLTYYLASQRNRLCAWLREIDDEDNWSVRGFLSFLEDFWALIAIVLFFVVPVLAFLFAAVFFGLLLLVNAIINHRENKQRYPCPSCENAVLPTALRCPDCKGELTPNRRLSWSLFSGPDAAADMAVTDEVRSVHQQRLLSRNRCPACAERVKATEFIESGCPQCEFAFDCRRDGLWFSEYYSAIMRRGWTLLLPVLLVSIIPAVGFSIAYVAIKVAIAGPLWVFLGGMQKFTIRWGLRLVLFILLIPSCIPGLSIIAVPLLLIINLMVYGHYARKEVAVSAASNPALVEDVQYEYERI